MTTSLSDLSDVGDLSGASDNDYLGYDQTSELWVPMAPPAAPAGSFVQSTGTLTYPAGDNGWVYVDDASASPYVQDHIQNTTAIPAADAALLTTFTVTSAMLNVGGTSGLDRPYKLGLWVVLSGVPDVATASVTRVHAEIGGTDVGSSVGTIFSNRVRVAHAIWVPCQADDVIRLHAWKASGAGDTVNFQYVLACPQLGQANVFPSSDDDKWVSQIIPSAPGLSLVESNPDGLTFSWAGANNNTLFEWRRQTVPGGQEFRLSSVMATIFQVGSPGRNGFRSQQWDYQDSTSSGDPLAIIGNRPTSYNFWTAVMDDPTVGV